MAIRILLETLSTAQAALDSCATPGSIQEAALKDINKTFTSMDKGWALFETDLNGSLQIQREDDLNIFETDEDAIAFVRFRAEQGHSREVDAIKLHDKFNPV